MHARPVKSSAGAASQISRGRIGRFVLTINNSGKDYSCRMSFPKGRTWLCTSISVSIKDRNVKTPGMKKGGLPPPFFALTPRA
jgi:hypothetical protein